MSNARTKIELIPYLDVREYKNNPRKNKQAVSAVKASIEKFGFNGGILIDSNNEIIAGHTRYKALVELGYKEIPCIRITDLDENKIKALRIADNKSGELADWDWDLLERELKIISNQEINFEDFGFGKDYLDSLFKQNDLVKPTIQDFNTSTNDVKEVQEVNKEKAILTEEEALSFIQNRNEHLNDVKTIREDKGVDTMSITVFFKKDKLEEVMQLLNMKHYSNVFEYK